MAGTLIRILPKTDIVATAVGTTAMEVPLGDFDSRLFTTMILIARIHAKSITSSPSQTVNFFLRNLAPSIEDIAADFAQTTSIATATFTIHSGTAGVQVPQIVQASGTLSYKMRLIMSYSQTTAGAVFTFSTSVDALGRE